MKVWPRWVGLAKHFKIIITDKLKCVLKMSTSICKGGNICLSSLKEKQICDPSISLFLEKRNGSDPWILKLEKCWCKLLWLHQATIILKSSNGNNIKHIVIVVTYATCNQGRYVTITTALDLLRGTGCWTFTTTLAPSFLCCNIGPDSCFRVNH